MPVNSDLYQSWILFRAAVLKFCETEQAYSKNLAIDETEWHLGRIRAIVASITPETLPRLDPVHLDTLRGFLADWEAEPARMRQGTWDERKRMLRNYLEVQARVIEDAIQQVEAARQTAEPPNASLRENRIIVGDAAIVLEKQEQAVVKALAELRAAETKALAKQSGYKYPANVLKRLIEKHPILSGLISMPRARGRGGYSTTIKLVV